MHHNGGVHAGAPLSHSRTQTHASDDAKYYYTIQCPTPVPPPPVPHPESVLACCASIFSAGAASRQGLSQMVDDASPSTQHHPRSSSACSCPALEAEGEAGGNGVGHVLTSLCARVSTLCSAAVAAAAAAAAFASRHSST